jgi:hypothetical protein
MFQLINKNFLVPIITKYDTFDEGLDGLQQETILRLSEYTDKVYMIEKRNESTIYTSDGLHIYMNTKLFDNSLKKIIYTNKKVNYFGTEYYQNIRIEELNFNNNVESTMNLKINEKKNSNVRFVNDIDVKEQEQIQVITRETEIESKIETNTNTNTKTKTNTNTNSKTEPKIETTNNEVINIDEDNKKKEINNKRDEIIKMIEEVNELYQKELHKIRKYQLNLKTYDTKLEKLEKTKKDNIINDIIRTQSEYRTWKKIKYGLKEIDDIDILKPTSELKETNELVPILFLSKYNYIEKIQNNDSICKLLDEINQLNLNDLYADNLLPNNNIVQFCNKYMNLSKELHYHFDDHEWSYLENELNLNSTNKLGSNVVSSSKIQ